MEFEDIELGVEQFASFGSHDTQAIIDTELSIMRSCRIGSECLRIDK